MNIEAANNLKLESRRKAKLESAAAGYTRSISFMLEDTSGQGDKVDLQGRLQ